MGNPIDIARGGTEDKTKSASCREERIFTEYLPSQAMSEKAM